MSSNPTRRYGLSTAGVARLLAVGRAAGDPAASVLVTPLAGPGMELVLGSFRDPAFGQGVMLGVGGVLVAALGDVVFRLAPLTVAAALAMPDALLTCDVARTSAPLIRGILCAS